MLRGGMTLPSSVTKLAMIKDWRFARKYDSLERVCQGGQRSLVTSTENDGRQRLLMIKPLSAGVEPPVVDNFEAATSIPPC
jgi:hypothetical protein